MYPVSDAFLAAIRQSHIVANRLDVTTADGTVLDTIYPSVGSVTVDSNRSVRRECSFGLPDYDGSLTPASLSDPLSSVTGNELRPYRGVKYADGSTEYAPLGVFPIRKSSASVQDGVPVIALSGLDRSSTVSRNRWTAPYIIPSGTSLEVALASVLQSRAPNYPTSFNATGFVLPTESVFGLNSDNDPWDDAVRLARSGGYDLYYDVTGTAVISKAADPSSTTPILVYQDGDDNVVLSPAKDWDSDKAYNGAIVIGESSGIIPVRAEAWDDDPTSPTYRLGSYGSYPQFFFSELIQNENQAQAVADYLLAKSKGVAQTVSWSQLVNPALEAGDCIGFSNSRLRVSSQINVVIDTLTIPWSPSDSMSATTRAVQVTA